MDILETNTLVNIFFASVPDHFSQPSLWQ